MTSSFNACDVTVANSNHKISYNFFSTCTCAPTLKKVPLAMVHGQRKSWEPLIKRNLATVLQKCLVLNIWCKATRFYVTLDEFLRYSIRHHFLGKRMMHGFQ